MTPSIELYLVKIGNFVGFSFYYNLPEVDQGLTL
jgi:hypothetical protein